MIAAATVCYLSIQVLPEDSELVYCYYITL